MLSSFAYRAPQTANDEGQQETEGARNTASGPKNDVRFVQISAPVQPGNSGGPLLDSSGHVIGVVVATLDAIQVAEMTGNIPQNINFAVHWAEVKSFLDEAGMAYQRERSIRPISRSAIAAAAKRFSVEIVCSN